MAASARPSAISRAAVPMASIDEAQAVHTVSCWPWRSYFMAIWAAAMFGQILIIVLRGTLSGPCVSSRCWASSRARVPPMLVPWTIAVRSGSSSPIAGVVDRLRRGRHARTGRSRRCRR